MSFTHSDPTSAATAPGSAARTLRRLREIRRLCREHSSYGREPVAEALGRWQRVRTPDLPFDTQPYDPAWPKLFRRERQRLMGLLGDRVADVFHIGSTAIPPLPSKNILDLAVLLADDAEEGATGAVIGALRELDYEDYGESPIAPRTRWFWRIEADRQAFVLHVSPGGAPWVEDALAFRDYLRAEPAVRQRYRRRKAQLKGGTEGDYLGYSLGKFSLMATLLDEARRWREGEKP